MSNLHSRPAVARLLGVIAALFVYAPVAQGWEPQRRVELVVPGGAAGSLDTTARTVHKAWEELKLLPKGSGVNNKPGGEHAVGYTYVSQRAGDPHFLGLATSVLLTGHITGRIPITYSDVTPLAFLVTEYVVFAVREDSPLKTGKDFLHALGKNPGALSISVGSDTHRIAAALPLQSEGVNIKPVKIVAFNGGKQILAVLGGHVDVSVSGSVLVEPHVQAGKMRVIAVSSPRRMGGTLATVPTWEELGYKATIGSWRAMFAAHGVTPDQVAFWEQAFKKVVESEEFRKDAEKNQWDSTFMGAADTRKFMEREYAQLKSVMTYLGMSK
jgi:putative tricarboxylic transport membrane protein